MSARILIVDDTALNVKLLSAKLAHEYYELATASNGAEALAKTQEFQPDLILLDVMMPEMDGFETCRRLKENPATRHIPVVMITALSDVADRVKGLAAGADDFLGKPINDVALTARIRSLLRLKVLMDEWRLRETAAQSLSPVNDAPAIDPLDIRDSRILIVDDNPADSDFIISTLEPLAAHIAKATSIVDAEKLMASGTYDMVFANLDLSQEDGLSICPRLRSNPVSRHTPILLLGMPEDMERVARGLDLGANDYLLRPFDKQELFARTRTQLRHKRNYERLRNGFEQNIKMALTDPLTGAFNRRYLDTYFPQFVQQAKEKGRSLSVQMLDIDHFKSVNDRFGHSAGDDVLREVARRLSNGIRPSDFFVRMGGEEFAIIMPDTFLPSAYSIAERLRQSIANTPIPLPDGAAPLSVTISIGVADTKPSSEANPEKVFDRADAALYRAKHSGRNRTVLDGEAAKSDAEFTKS